MKILFILFSLGLFVNSCNQVHDKKSVNEKAVSKITSNQKIISSYLFSKNLNRKWNYTIYLPPNYQKDTLNKYRILYLLHGHGGNNESWMGSGEIKSMLDELIISNKINPFIIVMPDGENSWFLNHLQTNYCYA